MVRGWTPGVVPHPQWKKSFDSFVDPHPTRPNRSEILKNLLALVLAGPEFLNLVSVRGSLPVNFSNCKDISQSVGLKNTVYLTRVKLTSSSRDPSEGTLN